MKNILSLPDIPFYRSTCPFCGCEFEYTADEVEYLEYDGYMVVCPHCFKSLRVEDLKLQTPWRHEHPERPGISNLPGTVSIWNKEC